MNKAFEQLELAAGRADWNPAEEGWEEDWLDEVANRERREAEADAAARSRVKVYIHKEKGRTERMMLTFMDEQGTVHTWHPEEMVIKRFYDMRFHGSEAYCTCEAADGPAALAE